MASAGGKEGGCLGILFLTAVVVFLTRIYVVVVVVG